MGLDQLKRFSEFLAEHPGFTPMLAGDDALICGFQVGGACLTISEMDEFIAANPTLGHHSVA